MMEKDESTLATVELQRETEFPPLRVHHFLLWTVVAAIWLSITQYEIHELQSFPTDDRVQMIALTIASRIVESVMITICIVGILGWRRGYRFPSQPGHWIAVSMATTTVPVTLCSALKDTFGLVWNLNSDVWFYLDGVLSAVWCIVFFVVAKRWRERTVWRVFYFLFGVISGLSALTTLLFYLTLSNMSIELFQVTNVIAMFVLGIIALTAILAMLTDRIFSIPRDWAHWLSVLLPFAFGIVAAGWAIIARLIAKF